MNKKMFVYNHQRKGSAFANALKGAGYQYSQVKEARVILMDVDTAGRMNPIKRFLKNGKARAFCYPHSARPFLGWDGIFNASSMITASFVFAEGHKEILRSFGYKQPLHHTGWTYSELRKFQPVKKPINILFAPIHPNRSGTMAEVYRQANAETYRILLKLVDTHGINLVTRHLGELTRNGLWEDARTRLVRGDADISQVNEMEEADVIVSHQTYAHIAIAKGKPTVMIAENLPPRCVVPGSDDRIVKSWENYKHLLMYPFDILGTPDPYELLVRACESDTEIADWRTRLIGDTPFDPKVFSETVSNYFC